jgi:adenosylmethionine-8-amino-7-oxononanoate aminotransferase
VAYGGTSAQGIEPNRAGFGPLVEGVFQTSHEDLAEVERVFEAEGDRIAAVIAEPVIAAGGVRPPSAGYLDGLRRLCDDYGALLIFDEVVTGFGRLGTWWAADTFGVTPDLSTFAKGCTSGYLPLGGVVVGRIVREALEADPAFVLRHGHTYSGHATACAAGLENLRILRDEHLLDRPAAIEARLGAGLRALAADGVVAETRGMAGIWAVDLPDGFDAAAVRDEMMCRGVIPRPLGVSTIAFCPPLVIDDDDLDRCVEVLAESVAALRD